MQLTCRKMDRVSKAQQHRLEPRLEQAAQQHHSKSVFVRTEGQNDLIGKVHPAMTYRHHKPNLLISVSAPIAIFFCKRGLPSRDISANHMARILR